MKVLCSEALALMADDAIGRKSRSGAIARELAIALLFLCLSVAAELLPVPLSTVLAGDDVALWGRMGGGGSACTVYRWRVSELRQVLVDGDGLGEWRSLEDDVHCQQKVSFGLSDGSNVGSVTLCLEIGDGKTISEQAELVLTVKRAEALSHSERVDIRKRQHVLQGLHWLACHQQADGHWGENLVPILGRGEVIVYEQDLYNEAGSTGFALWAFGVHGFGLVSDGLNPFMENVLAGIRYLANHTELLAFEPDGLQGGMNADENGNRRAAVIGGHSNVENYVNPICLSGLVASGRESLPLSTSAGEMTLGELVSDAGDFIIKQLSNRGIWYQSWSYYDDLDGPLPDLSIAGWNYIAIEAMRQWGRVLPMPLYRAIFQTLDGTFDGVRNKFVYNSNSLDNTSVSVQASGILGLRLILDDSTPVPELLTMRTSDECYDEVSRTYLWGQQKVISLGEAQVHSARHVMEWLESCQCGSQGYNLWNAVKALMIGNITKQKIQGRIYDWRYGFLEEQTDGAREPSGGGVWERIIHEQAADGHWPLDEDVSDSYLSSSQLELHTACMLLALSEEVFPKEKKAGIPMDITCVLAPEIAETAVPWRGLTKEIREDGSTVLKGAFILLEGETVELGYDYLAGSASDNELTPVQLGGTVCWTDEAGKERALELDELAVERRGNAYGLNVSWGGERHCGRPLGVAVAMVLPDSDCLAVLTLPEKERGIIQLFSSSSFATWLGIQWLGNDGDASIVEKVAEASASVQWLTRADSRLTAWRAIQAEEWREGVRGRVFGAEIVEPLTHNRVALLNYNDMPLTLKVTTFQEDGNAMTLLEHELSPNEFGKTTAMTLPIGNCLFHEGDLLCRGEIWRGDELVVMDEDRIVLEDYQAGEVTASLDCSVHEVERGTPLNVWSEVSAVLGGAVGVEASVEIEVNGGGQWAWSYDGRLSNGRQRQEYHLDTSGFDAGKMVIRQIVRPDNGQEALVSVAEVLVKETIAVRGRFEFEHYELEGTKPAHVNYIVENIYQPEHVEVVEIEVEKEMKLKVGEASGNAVATGVEGSVAVSSVKGDLEAGDEAWLALKDIKTDELLDVTVVRLRADTTKPEPTVPEPTEPEPTEPEPTEPEPTEPEPTVPEPTEPEPTEPEPTEPEPTEPEPTEPEPTEPEPTEPEPMVPEPTEPEPMVPEPKDHEPKESSGEPVTETPSGSVQAPTEIIIPRTAVKRVEQVYTAPGSVLPAAEHEAKPVEMAEKRVERRNAVALPVGAEKAPSIHWVGGTGGEPNEVHGRFGATKGRLPPWRIDGMRREKVVSEVSPLLLKWFEDFLMECLGTFIKAEDVVL